MTKVVSLAGKLHYSIAFTFNPLTNIVITSTC